MSHTVIGIFKSFTEASVAKQHLENNGFNASNVDINDSSYTAPDYAGNQHHHEKKDDDSIGGFFRNLFSSDDDDDDLTNRHIDAGKRGTVVTVHAGSYDEAEQAADILDEFGAVNVNDSDDWDNMDGNSSDTTSDLSTRDTPGDFIPSATPAGGFATTGTTGDDDTTGNSIKVVEESLEVGKEEISTGGVRLHSRIVSRPVEESIRLRQERVTVNRTPVDRPASEGDFNTFQEGTIEMTESAEIPVVSKDARVVEEISLDKEVTETDQTIVDTVRHTEVDTENLDPDKDRHIL